MPLSGHREVATIYERQGRQKEAIEELLIALKYADEQKLAVSVQQRLNSSGYWPARETFLRGDLLEKQERIKKGQLASADAVAGDYALLGENDKAFAWLGKSYQAREGVLMYLNVDDRFACGDAGERDVRMMIA